MHELANALKWIYCTDYWRGAPARCMEAKAPGEQHGDTLAADGHGGASPWSTTLPPTSTR